MSYETHFQLSVYMNGQNIRYRCPDNASEIHESFFLGNSVACGVVSFAVIGPHIFKNKQHKAVTVNSEIYLEMVGNFLGPEMHRLCIRNLRFKSEVCHISYS
jgi:hypothetical protein